MAWCTPAVQGCLGPGLPLPGCRTPRSPCGSLSQSSRPPAAAGPGAACPARGHRRSAPRCPCQPWQRVRGAGGGTPQHTSCDLRGGAFCFEGKTWAGREPARGPVPTNNNMPGPPAVAQLHQLAGGQHHRGVAGDGVKHGETGGGRQRRGHLLNQVLGAAAQHTRRGSRMGVTGGARACRWLM